MKKRKTKWEKALEQIEYYCGKHNGCAGCRIYNTCNHYFREPPEDWKGEDDETGDM